MSQRERRPSISMLLRRSKSSDLIKGGKKAQAQREAELERQRQASRVPPKLPEFANHSEQLSKSFGNDLSQDSTDAQYHTSRREQQYQQQYGRPSMDPSIAPSTSVPIPPIPGNAFDPYARTESMTHRGRYSYASSAVSTINSPRRVRRRKDPTTFNILIIGTRNSGKTSFLEFLKSALALPPKKRTKKAEEDDFELAAPTSGNFIPHYLETEIDGERIGLTLWDSEGLERNVVDLQLREMSAFVESKFEETFNEEMKVVRSPGVQDTHIHAAFLVLDPGHLDRNIAAARLANGQGRRSASNGHGAPGSRASGALDEDIDMQVLRTLQRKTTVIPVISKADTITTKHMNVLKRTVWDTLKKSNMDPLDALGLDDDDGSNSSSRIAEEDEELEEEEEDEDNDNAVDDGEVSDAGSGADQQASPTPLNAKRLSSNSVRRHKAQEEAREEENETPFLPLSIISPDLYEPGIVGRQFPWGFADPYNAEHCDFTKLKEAVFSEWRAELRVASREQWYEGWRTNRLKQRDLSHRRR